MLIGLLLVVAGIILIVVIPILGLFAGVPLIVIGLFFIVFGAMAKGAGAVLGIGSGKTCPECRSEIPIVAVVCRLCGFRFN